MTNNSNAIFKLKFRYPLSEVYFGTSDLLKYNMALLNLSTHILSFDVNIKKNNKK